MLKTPEEMSLAIARAASDKKARDIVTMRMTELTTATDYFVICLRTQRPRCGLLPIILKMSWQRKKRSCCIKKVIERASGYYWIMVNAWHMYSCRKVGSFMLWNVFGAMLNLRHMRIKLC